MCALKCRSDWADFSQPALYLLIIAWLPALGSLSFLTPKFLALASLSVKEEEAEVFSTNKQHEINIYFFF